MAEDKTDKADDISWAEMKPQLLKLAIELGPLLIFYLGFSFGNRIIAAVPQFSAAGFNDPLYPATLLFMLAMLGSIVLGRLLLHRIAVMPVVTAVVVLVFGALTFYFHDTTFAKMKPTVINALFGVVLLGGLLFGQSLLRHVFGEVYRLKPAGWTVLTLRWGIFFLLLAVANEVVWRLLGDNLWASYKTFVTPLLTIAFAALQLPVLSRYASPREVQPVPPIDPTG